MRHSFEHLVSTGYPIADVRRFLRYTGRLDTLRHVAQIASVGRQLARRFELPVAQADLACTAHDIAAVVPLRDIIAVAETFGMRLSDADRAIPQVVHGPLAAILLRDRLGVRDEDVLNSVRHHSTLRLGASPLEQLVFIADKIALDPTTHNAGFHPGLVRAFQSGAPLAALCSIYLDWAVREGPRLGWHLHPNLLDAYKSFGQQSLPV
jgi:predicted HD superfamily hydrolase involved in NAD metabolism